MPPTTSSPYRALPQAKRLALVTRAVALQRETRALYIQRVIAKGGGFRAVTLQGWSPDRLAREVVRLNAESAADELDLLQLLYVDLEPAVQITFLDAAGVPHTEGRIQDDLEPPYADADAVARGVAAVRAAHGAAEGDDGSHYLRTIARYGQGAWPGIDAALAAPTA